MNLYNFFILVAILFCLWLPIIILFRRTLIPETGSLIIRTLRGTRLPWGYFLAVVLLAQLGIFLAPVERLSDAHADLFFAIFALTPLVSIATAVSCLRSRQPSLSKAIWIGVSFLAPILGPLLWFCWGEPRSFK